MAGTPDSLSMDDAMEQALACFQAGNLEQALALYQAVLKTDPSHATANHNVGAIALKMNRPGEALQFFNAALKSDPDTEQHWVSLVQTLALTEQKDLAQQMLEDARKFGVSTDALEQMERVLNPRNVVQQVEKADPDELVLPELDPALRQHGSAPAQRIKDLQNLLRKNHLNKALKEIDRLIEKYPGDSRLHDLRGWCLYNRNELKHAEEALEKALALQPDNASVAETLAKTYVHRDRFDKGAAAYKRALSLTPENHGLLLRYADALHQSHRFDEAVELCERSISRAINTLNARLLAGQSRMKQHRYEEAEQFYRKAAQDNPKNMAPHSFLADLFTVQGDHDRAIAHYNAALRFSPKNNKLLLNLARSHLHNGDRTQATSLIRQIIESNPNDARAYFDLYEIASFDSSAPEYGQLIRLCESGSASTYERTIAHFVLGNIRLRETDDQGAFNAFHEGNRLAAFERPELSGIYGFTRRMTQSLDRRFFNTRLPMGQKSSQPLFITGLPRSGKSLAEKLLAQSPDVATAQELAWLNNMLPKGGRVQDLLREAQSITQRQLNADAASLLQGLRNATGSNARYITETTPKTLALSYFAQMFPQAPVIFFDRDPWDLLATIYFKYFSKGNEFSFNIALLEQHIMAEKRLTAHWLEVLPNPCLRITYESLVEDPVTVGREMAAFLDIQWDDSYAANLQLSAGADTTIEEASPINSVDFNTKPVPLTNEFIGFGERFKEFFLPHIPRDTPFEPPEE